MRAVSEALRQLSEPAVRRQKRETVSYWDAMTCLENDEFLPPRLHDCIEYRLATDLVEPFAAGTLEPRHSGPIAVLGELESIRAARSHVIYEFGDTSQEGGRPIARPCIDRVDFGIDGNWRFRRAGPCRALEIEMGDLKGRADTIDWPRAHLLAVLIQMRTDIELYLETGFMRIHRCERAACRSFFKVKRMAGRQRFCSNACRAGAARDHA
jgi:hypothetical protein